MENKNKNSLGFNMFIDKDRMEVFQLLLNVYKDFLKTAPPDFFVHSELEGRNKAIVKFVEDMIIPQHELGWCSDPTCDYETSKFNPKNKQK